MYLTNGHTYTISYLLHLYNQFHNLPVILTWQTPEIEI